VRRRHLLKQTAALPFAGLAFAGSGALAAPVTRRVRPSDLSWPSASQWDQLNAEVGGALLKPHTVWEACAVAPGSASCDASLKNIHNPFFLGDDPGGTQVAGWLDAWRAEASRYAVRARDARDVAAAVRFARRHNLRLVVKGGGHSYLGGSNAPDSLLVWTRAMDGIELHEGFVPDGCTEAPTHAVTVGAGCMWIDVYAAVTGGAGRYVQGGGCATVGVAGLVQGGGFGSFSKRYGLAASSLLQAEIVTADGAVRTINARKAPDLFWALKGGGGGAFGVVTKLTLQTHELPDRFGYVGAKVHATSDDAFRRLVGRFIDHYAERLFNPHWGEAANLSPDRTLEISMVCQGLDDAQVRETWRPFFDWIRAAPQDLTLDGPFIGTAAARGWWDPRNNPAMIKDDRRDASPGHAFWRGDQEQVSLFIHGYDSVWMPASLLAPDRRVRLADALIGAARFMTVRLHFNKGLAGAPPEVNAQARQIATNPAVADAFCLMIVATGGAPPFPGLPVKADAAEARRNAMAVASAAAEIEAITPNAGSYVSETDYFRKDWREAFWGANYPRLKAIKDRWDPQGLFIVHHGVGSEEWSPDGFTRASV
jgi:FAD/FMN-containing dehydrogenase